MRPLTTPKRTDWVENGFVFVNIEGTVELKFSVSQHVRLSKCTEAQLKSIEVSPFGLHWPELDEELSFDGLMRGNLG
jgi:Protein of unknown function (DUF2442)